MRVVHVTNGDEVALMGFERHALNLATAQRARGFSTLVVTDRPGPLVKACQQRDVAIVIEPALRPAGPITFMPVEQTKRALTGRFSSFNAEVIHCHTPPAAAQTIPIANNMRIPCIFTEHSALYDDESEAPPLMVAKRRGMRFTTICVCRKNFERLRNAGMSESDVHYVPNGTESASPSVRSRKARQPGRPDLTLVGSLKMVKGIDIAILMMAELRRRRLQHCPTLYLYGEGDQREYFEEIAEVLELNDIVKFCGFQLDIIGQRADTDILLVSSRFETGPIVVLEAMSRGMPIVTTDVGEAAEMLPDPRYGRIAPVRSIVALADAVESLLSDISEGRFEPELLIERHQSLYTSEKMSERIEEIYKQVLAQAG